MADRNAAVLAGGLSHERDVSLRSGRRLSAALRDEGLAVEEWDTDAGLLERLRIHRPDAVIIALHGGEGENGSVQTVLEMLDVPYVGTGSQGCRRAWDKPTAKALLEKASSVSLLSYGMCGWDAVVWQVVPLSDKDGCCALAEKAAGQVSRAGS